MVFFPILILAISLAILVFASEKIVSSAVKLAQLTGFNEFAMGTIFIAIGTSLPELTISILSVFEKKSSLSAGLLLGSSIADMTIVFGIVCFACFVLKKHDIEIIETVALSSMLIIFALILGTIDILFGVFAILIFYLFMRTIIKRHYTIKSEKPPWIVTPEIVKQFAILIGSIIVVVVSAKFVVSSATEIASFFNISSVIIGSIIIGLGTVLPETVVSIIAIKKKNLHLAIGNIVGSVVVNIALVLGLVSIASPIVLDGITKIIMLSFLAISAVLVLIAFRKTLTKKEGILMIVIYCIFVFITVISGAFV
ncbi:MAG: sodium:calcium antiporter [Candidatus Aenigmarchaeota archaeon]|nr:sodium:calcium antiporter [Candidatus Aenigmarchaeota archaeon]